MIDNNNWYYERFIKRLNFEKKATTDIQKNPFTAGNFSRLDKEGVYPPVAQIVGYMKILHDLTLKNFWFDGIDYNFEIDLNNDFSNFIHIHEHVLDVYSHRYNTECNTVPIMALLYKASPQPLFSMPISEWIKTHHLAFREQYEYYSRWTKECTELIISDVVLSCGKYHNFNKFFLFSLPTSKMIRTNEDVSFVDLDSSHVLDLLTSYKHEFCDVGHYEIFMIEHNIDLLSKIKLLRNDTIVVRERR